MATRKKSYYVIRSIVRHVFWTSVIFGFFLAFGALTEALKSDKCDVDLNFDFTWTWVTPMDLSECQMPHNVILHNNYTWEWEG